MIGFIGIDIGSTSTKAIAMDTQGQICHRILQPTGWSSIDAAQQVRSRLEELGMDVDQSEVVATGYGRVAVPYADKCITEISCHARGAAFLYGEPNFTVVDIGGQDTKLIEVADGQVKDFLMNDKCSAGTGRFLEVMANTLGVQLAELFRLAAHGSGVSISSMCTVFAESEVISLIGQGEPRENIAFAVVDSIVQKVCAQAGRLQSGGTVFLTGGLCDIEYLRYSLSEALHTTVVSSSDGRYAGAIGAAISAKALRK